DAADVAAVEAGLVGDGADQVGWLHAVNLADFDAVGFELGIRDALGTACRFARRRCVAARGAAAGALGGARGAASLAPLAAFAAIAATCARGTLRPLRSLAARRRRALLPGRWLVGRQQQRPLAL